MEEGGTEERRLVLIGNTRSGKSASANTIVGQRLFESEMSASSVTRDCQRETTDITVEEDGRTVTVTVVDTPGFGDTHLSEDEILTKIAQCVSLSAPGPHAFLLAVPIGGYTENENQAASQFVRMFGDKVRHHTLVLFTKGDELELEDTTIEEYLREAPESLRDLINWCEGRYHVFNNRDRNNSTQVKDLLMKVDNMVMQNNNNNNNNNGFYTNAMYEEAVAAIREEQLREEQRLRDQQRVQAPEGRGEPRMRQVRTRPQTTRSSSGSMRRETPLSPTVLQRVKRVVAATATGLAVGAVLGAAVPLVAAGGAYVGGSFVSLVAGQISGPAAAAAATEAAGVIVAAASGKTAVAVGAGVGASVGGVTGVLVGVDAESPGEAAMETLEQVGVMGGAAVGVAAGVGAVLGAGAALMAFPVEAALGVVTGGAAAAASRGLTVSVNRCRRVRYVRDNNRAAYEESDSFQFNIGHQSNQRPPTSEQ
ncbi:uncharacterized protein V6R79_021490 [Siganus canaliculatus]